MTIKGTVIGIIYVNEENGYSVIEFEADNRYFTAVGIFPIIEEGEMLALSGEFKENPKFGEQFVVESVEFIKPDDVESIKKYLSSGLFKGIGEKMANQIVNYFGAYTLEVIENHPQELKKISGIGDVKLADIVESYNRNREMKEVIFFLQKQEISMNLALKIYRVYGDVTISAVKCNPYILVKDIEGVGFLTADKIAMKLGIEEDSPFRIQAAIYHSLSEAASRSGHTCLPVTELIKETASLLRTVNSEKISECLRVTEGIKFVTVDDVEMAATQINFNTEKAIATKLLTLEYTARNWDFDIEKELEIYQKTSGIMLHENQKNAIHSVFENGVSIITGGPGTGKTTIIKGITNILNTRNLKVALCAPTGRASKRMSEATLMEAKTIHRLLGIEYGEDGMFCYNYHNPLEADAVIVDEISMADIYIFNALLKAIPQGARLILVGDKDQLPSVSCGNILSDIINSGLVNVVYLTEIYRQSKESMIVVNAHRINRGEMPIVQGAKDFFIDNKNNSLDILNSIISMTKSRIPQFLNIDPREIQVLAPVKKGLIGVENLNAELQKALNPNGKEYHYKDIVFREGDKVMQTVNNYTTEWVRNGYIHDSGKGVFNGDIGYVTEVYDDKIRVEFDDGKTVTYKDGDMDELALAYCVSVHKSQGSEFDVVIMVVSGGNYMILTKNLLYTAVTRAKKMVVIVGNEENVRKMISNNYTAKRYSLLKHFMVTGKEKVEMLWGIN
ncbi:MAG TPA: ATP-dependent RecD-like DNA helicase [Clostridia bacterium]|nr:ATP-dependent RecD-like DNA helicase [Clostridia bacterium]